MQDGLVESRSLADTLDIHRYAHGVSNHANMARNRQYTPSSAKNIILTGAGWRTDEPERLEHPTDTLGTCRYAQSNE